MKMKHEGQYFFVSKIRLKNVEKTKAQKMTKNVRQKSTVPRVSSR